MSIKVKIILTWIIALFILWYEEPWDFSDAPQYVALADITDYGYGQDEYDLIVEMIEYGVDKLNIHNADIDYYARTGKMDNKHTLAYMRPEGYDDYTVVFSVNKVIMTDNYQDGVDSGKFNYRWVVGMADTVFHELVHVWQYENGNLRDTYAGTLWNGKIYHRSKVAWGDRPWEQHAVKHACNLTKSFFADRFDRNIGRC